MIYMLSPIYKHMAQQSRKIWNRVQYIYTYKSVKILVNQSKIYIIYTNTL